MQRTFFTVQSGFYGWFMLCYVSYNPTLFCISSIHTVMLAYTDYCALGLLIQGLRYTTPSLCIQWLIDFITQQVHTDIPCPRLCLSTAPFEKSNLDTHMKYRLFQHLITRIFLYKSACLLTGREKPAVTPQNMAAFDIQQFRLQTLSASMKNYISVWISSFNHVNLR